MAEAGDPGETGQSEEMVVVGVGDHHRGERNSRRDFGRSSNFGTLSRAGPGVDHHRAAFSDDQADIDRSRLGDGHEYSRSDRLERAHTELRHAAQPNLAQLG